MTDEQIERLIRERSFVSLGPDKLSDRTATLFASLIALRRAVETCGVRHAVSFHSSISRAKEFQKLSQEFNRAVPELPEVASFHVSGKMPSGERDAVLRDFAASGPSLVTNARCLTEGVDVPKIDCVLFADPKGSTTDVVQAVGRALRLAAGKLRGHIIIPFVVPEGAALDAAAESAGFAFIVFVLRALASNDERIVDELRAISRGQPPKTGRILNFDVSAVFPVAMEAEQFINAIELKCWGRLAQLAPMTYEAASEFVQSIGVRSQKQFRKWRRGAMPDLPPVPEDLPANPNNAYHGRGWKTWGEFFRTGYVSAKLQTWKSFTEARDIVRSLGLDTQREWDLWRQNKLPEKGLRPNGVPAFPAQFYATEWVSWNDWIGKPLRPEWLPFLEARSLARNLKLPGQKAWKRYSAGGMPHLPTRPKNIPTAPDSVYAGEGWVNYGDWLGTGNTQHRRVTPREFHAAREFARSLGMSKRIQWRKFSFGKLTGFPPRPPDIPWEPQKTYADKGWAGWDDWLGKM